MIDLAPAAHLTIASSINEAGRIVGTHKQYMVPRL